MAKAKTVKIMLNIGLDDVKAHALDRAFQRDEIVSLDERQAAIVISRGWGKEYTDTVRAEEEAEHEKVRAAAVRAAMPEALKKVAVDEAKAEAEKIIHAGPSARAKNVKEAADAEEPTELSAKAQAYVNEISDKSADEAINSIRHLSDKEKLQAIADGDRRTTVQQAARDRLAAL